VIVGGRTIVKEGHLTGIDYPAMREDLLARFRNGMSGNAALAAALPALEQAIAANFSADTPCC
jgi:hypothetical protein